MVENKSFCSPKLPKEQTTEKPEVADSTCRLFRNIVRAAGEEADSLLAEGCRLKSTVKSANKCVDVHGAGVRSDLVLDTAEGAGIREEPDEVSGLRLLL